MVQCQLCPHYCALKQGETGKCHVRKNMGGKLVSLNYGKLCSANVELVEKKPLYHFLPGSKAYSIATAGCNLSCLHCQNWEISQQGSEKIPSIDLKPKEIVDNAIENECKSIAYTFTEPTIFYEMVLETAKKAREKHVKNVIVSNGFINEKPLKKLIPYIDAVNVDFKAMDEEHYKKICQGRLKPVLKTIKTLYKEGVWIELTNLLIPGFNDKEEQVKKLVRWVKENLGKEVPVHFSAFFPAYKMSNLPPTDPKKVKQAREIALDSGLKYIYSGNINEEDSTFCPNCDKLLIKRSSYNIIKNNLKIEKGEGKCLECGEKISGVWD